MPTAIEYGLMSPVVHTQNGAGGGPPAPRDFTLAQNGAGSGPPAQNHIAVVQTDVTPATPASDWLVAGPLATLLLVVAVAAAVRRYVFPRSPG
ncbi:hypothetical protein JOF56_010831 [Kibdelosporangium banguiense]|uniref:Uncharacterized protein n=1 Tax=Kibdelosporangium banguiense TaxID=1365924 RepID=A0ABS4U2M6_9PSEU|nr:hypothetical protein [Kibdelosporangium banguiense]MBP2330446.1 hypothetical protein [Kibdelosporangium banguiense]